MFIVLEGIDGAGKSTQIRFLTQLFQQHGHQVVNCADPGTTDAGIQIRQILLGRHEIKIAPKTELLLFMSARAQLVEEIIAPALAENKVVICDRFLLSSVVYQGHLGNILPETIWKLGEFVIDQSRPDLMIVLDLPAEVATQRSQGKPDRIESRGIRYLESVRRSFLAEAVKYPDLIKTVDATKSAQLVSQQVCDLVLGYLKSV